MKENQEESKDYTKLSIALVVGLTAALLMFMILGIFKISTDKDIKRAELLVEEESYQEAIAIYDEILSSKNSPQIKEKRDLALKLMDPEERKKAEAEKAEAEKEEAKDSKKDQAKKEETKASKKDQAKKDETDKKEENQDEEEDTTSEEEDLPTKSVWAPRANIRSQPSENSSVVGVITKDTEVYIVDEQVESARRTWYKISVTVNGETIEGWMASNTMNN